VRGRLFGAPGHFHSRLPPYDVDGFPSIYSLKPMRGQLEKLVDFGRVNGGDIRVAVVTTDIETGEMVVFDTARGIGSSRIMCWRVAATYPSSRRSRSEGECSATADCPRTRQ
jgi:hypothetical protein